MRRNERTDMPSTGRSAVLLGAGAVGLTLASFLLKAGWTVTVAGARVHFGAIRLSDGIMSSSHRVHHISHPRELKNADTIILAVKSHQTSEISDWLAAVDSRQTTILVAQNGVDHVGRTRGYCPNANIIPAIIYFNAERTGAGQVVLRRIGHFDLCLPDEFNSHALVQEFSVSALRTDLSTDFTTRLWLKLIVNIAVNPLTALTCQPSGIMRDAAMIHSARSLMLEALPVARKEGAAITENDVASILGWIASIPKDSLSSMLQDRRAGVPLEYEALTGAVVRAGRRHQIETPLNEFVLSLLSRTKMNV